MALVWGTNNLPERKHPCQSRENWLWTRFTDKKEIFMYIRATSRAKQNEWMRLEVGEKQKINWSDLWEIVWKYKLPDPINL